MWALLITGQHQRSPKMPLCHLQSGFHSGYGCVTATLKVLNDVTIALDSKQYCAAIFIDLAKAFDTVDHSILVGRLMSIGTLKESSV